MVKYSALILLITGLLASCSKIQPKQNTEDPNVIIILIDDEGYGDVGAYGATGFQTPNIDKLASKGMRFTNF